MPIYTSVHSPQDVAGCDYDTILFNGSLQFFQDTVETAMGILNSGKGGGVVLSHVEWAKFVQSEYRSNPKAAIRKMPTISYLNEWTQTRWGDKYNVRVLTKEDHFEDGNSLLCEEEDLENDNFYLVALDAVPLQQPRGLDLHP